MFWYVVLFVVVVILMRRRSGFSFQCKFGNDDEEGTPELIARIKGARDKNELLDIVSEIDEENSYFSGKENDEFLAKALQFDLSKYDWAAVYYLAESGSKLEETTEERAGRAL